MTATVGEFMLSRGGSLLPSAFPDEEFELYSIPAHDNGGPEIARGNEIGSSKQLVHPGDVMISKIIPHIRRVQVVCGFTGRRQIASGEWIVLRGAGFLPGYLRHFLLSDGFHAQFMNTVAGVGGSLVRARPAQVRSIPLTLPPLEEQQRIAAILDQADAVRAKRRQVLTHLDALSRGLFTKAMHGTSRNEPLGEVASFVRGVTFKPSDKVESGPDTVAVMRTKNVQRRLDRRDEIHIPTALIKRSEQYLRLGDSLVSSANSWNLVGRACFIGELPEPAVIGGFVTALRPGAGVSAAWLHAWFTAASTQATLRSFSSQTTNIANLSLKRCLELQVPIPTDDARDDYEQATSAVARHEEIVADAVHAADALFQSLQARAFRGEL